jgi:serine/threonine-protein kinase
VSDSAPAPRALSPAAYERLAQVVLAHAATVPPTGTGAVGCYRLLDRIGRGSAGEVFRAVDPDGHEVALKLLHPRWKGERYARELELLERASAFQGVVPLLDAGVSPRGPYLVLELATGGSLRSHLKARTRLAPAEALELMGQVATTLAALHEEGIVHRDLKPENILLASDGRPLVSDFGLAKDLTLADGELTMAGVALGTIGYMAPELLAGDREKLGTWTDVFALGAVLHELVTGQLPFAGRTLVEAARSLRDDSLRALPGQSPGLRDLLARALAKGPKDRFRDAGELASAIRAVRAG